MPHHPKLITAIIDARLAADMDIQLASENTGYTQKILKRFEVGTSTPSPEQIERLALTYDCHPFLMWKHHPEAHGHLLPAFDTSTAPSEHPETAPPTCTHGPFIEALYAHFSVAPQMTDTLFVKLMLEHGMLDPSSLELIQ